jgi:hypothetical protein
VGQGSPGGKHQGRVIRATPAKYSVTFDIRIPIGSLTGSPRQIPGPISKKWRWVEDRQRLQLLYPAPPLQGGGGYAPDPVEEKKKRKKKKIRKEIRSLCPFFFLSIDCLGRLDRSRQRSVRWRRYTYATGKRVINTHAESY